MSTTEVTSLAVDLSTVGPIYPFVGTEFWWVAAGVVFWIAFHVWQIGFENRTYEQDAAKLATPDEIQRAMRRHELD
jgi:hypothetical protein